MEREVGGSSVSDSASPDNVPIGADSHFDPGTYSDPMPDGPRRPDDRLIYARVEFSANCGHAGHQSFSRSNLTATRARDLAHDTFGDCPAEIRAYNAAGDEVDIS